MVVAVKDALVLTCGIIKSSLMYISCSTPADLHREKMCGIYLTWETTETMIKNKQAHVNMVNIFLKSFLTVSLPGKCLQCLRNLMLDTF